MIFSLYLFMKFIVIILKVGIINIGILDDCRWTVILNCFNFFNCEFCVFSYDLLILIWILLFFFSLIIIDIKRIIESISLKTKKAFYWKWIRNLLILIEIYKLKLILSSLFQILFVFIIDHILNNVSLLVYLVSYY